ncbi:DNA glycosylase AlkZ-like family protein, partial [Nonomuraea aridisoli]
RRTPPPEEEPVVRLAPAFDEYLLGWRTRDPILAPEHARRVFPGGGVLRPVVLVDGVVAGVWGRKGTQVTVTPFGDLPAGPLEAELEDIHRFFQNFRRKA